MGECPTCHKKGTCGVCHHPKHAKRISGEGDSTYGDTTICYGCTYCRKLADKFDVELPYLSLREEAVAGQR